MSINPFSMGIITTLKGFQNMIFLSIYYELITGITKVGYQ